MNKKKVIIITSVAVCAAAGIGGYEYWKYEDAKKRATAYQTAKDSLVLELAVDPTIEYGDTIEDPEALAMSYVTDSSGNVTVTNADKLDSSKLGSVDLTYTVSATDTYGVEVLESKDLTVTVKDTKAPEITLESDSVSIQEGSDFDPLANVTEVKDPVDGDLDKATLTVDNPVDTAAPGDYTVSLSAADESGNTTDVSYAVTVTPKPVAKKTTTTASSNNTSSGSTAYAAADSGSESSYTQQPAASDSGTDVAVNDSSSNSSGGDWRYTISNDIIGQSKAVYDEGMEHYGEGTSWGAGIMPDGSADWWQEY